MIISLVVGIISAVVSTVATIGSAVVSFCTTTLPVIIPVLYQSLHTIHMVTSTITNILKIFEVFKSNDEIEDVGDRALQAAEIEITPDKFDNFDDYMNKIRSFKLDPEKSASFNQVEKITAGMAISSLGLEQKLNMPEGSMSGFFILASLHPEYFSTNRLMAILNATKDVGMVVDYFTDRLDATDVDFVESILVNAEKAISPDNDVSTIQADLQAAKQHFKQLPGK